MDPPSFVHYPKLFDPLIYHPNLNQVPAPPINHPSFHPLDQDLPHLDLQHPLHFLVPGPIQ
jgi:hypothetical protein